MTCTPHMVITRVDAVGGASPEGAPVWSNALYTLGAASMQFGRSENAISILLSRRAHLFDVPHYRRGQGNRVERLLTARDIGVLAGIFTVFVKPLPRVSRGVSDGVSEGHRA